ncbi:hypothetical protein [Paraliobacillus sp. X-1268]|uniref:hypothetical protein n=1 Tax=Paraliobacillus sp. X-1268 TaxID=2213193 RepID=UPI000E3CB0A9|nr:hypothetical protein [Paraliobacillus sp. X-1268]
MYIVILKDSDKYSYGKIIIEVIVLEDIGQFLIDIGLKILPFSFFAYIPFRWLTYLWKRRGYKLVKGIWYFTLGMGYVTNLYDVNYVVMFICFIEAWDLLLEHFEQKQTN